jgi:hypothetical protein
MSRKKRGQKLDKDLGVISKVKRGILDVIQLFISSPEILDMV